ncbi:MAG: hypothetical protein OXD01_08745 [Gammaproteobacteria bacterium]|nr:hypothetical protein [Gammaproteobacteria bacterium]
MALTQIHNIGSYMGRSTLLVALVICFMLLSPAVSQATTIARLPIGSIVHGAELIFEGRVLSHLVQHQSGTGIINTYVIFSVIDVIKGDFDAELVELKFSGGESQEEIFKVNGLRIPAVEEEGIYFVESVYRNLINPLLGWSQGHYVISEQNGERLVNTADATPVIDIQPMTDMPASIMTPLDLIDGNIETAAGIMTAITTAATEQALTVQQFKSRIVEILEN